MAAAKPQTVLSSRGAPRLLAHCAALQRAPVEPGSAWTRLEKELGGELTRRLLGALQWRGRRAGFIAF